jgi:hypothetical protein
MIPLFTPATARKDVNKVQGDGELAKLANLNRLVENVNTIVAQGLPSAAPTFTYTVTGGTIPEIQIDYGIGSGTLTNGVSGQNTIQTYYAPIISGISECTASSITFSTEVLGGLSWNFQNNAEYAPNIPIVNFPNLTKLINLSGLGGGVINLRNVSEVTTLSTPLLTNGQITIQDCNNFTTLNISSLTNDGSVSITNCDSLSLSGISFNSQFSAFGFNNCDDLGATISIAATEIKTTVGNCTNITTLSFPNAVTWAYTISIYGCSSLANLTLGSVGTLKSIYYDPIDGASVFLDGCALSSGSVTHVLDILISLDGTNGTTEWGAGSTLDISGGTNAIPSAGDLVKIATLEARGATIVYNT